jgi:uncharacterized damage-inducible protein DinB
LASTRQVLVSPGASGAASDRLTPVANVTRTDRRVALDDWYIAWSDRLTEREVERKVHFTFVGGGEGTMTCAEIALHLANHTTYRRGYIADMLYQVPVHPPTTDLMVFIRDRPLKLE